MFRLNGNENIFFLNYKLQPTIWQPPIWLTDSSHRVTVKLQFEKISNLHLNITQKTWHLYEFVFKSNNFIVRLKFKWITNTRSDQN